MTPDVLPDPIGVAIAVARVLEQLGIPYVVGGSLASSVHGEPRSTNDVDIVADLRTEHVARFVHDLGPNYYVDEDAVRDAVRSGGAFNLIHTGAAVKVDIFVAGDDAFDAERLRSRQQVLAAEDPPSHLFMDIAEYCVVRKLEWFRRGGEASERQWRDVLGILRVQRGRLDQGRLRSWSTRLGVTDLLERATREIEKA